MPLYQWKCKKCSHLVNVLRSIADIDREPEEDDVENVPCSPDGDVRYRHQWERLISRTSFHLTGNGWFNKGGY